MNIYLFKGEGGIKQLKNISNKYIKYTSQNKTAEKYIKYQISKQEHNTIISF